MQMKFLLVLMNEKTISRKVKNFTKFIILIAYRMDKSQYPDSQFKISSIKITLRKCIINEA